MEIETKITENINFSFFKDQLPISNILITECYMLFFSFNYMRYNLGFWFISSIIGIEILLFLSFCCGGMKTLRSEVYRYSRECPPMRTFHRPPTAKTTCTSIHNYLSTEHVLNENYEKGFNLTKRTKKKKKSKTKNKFTTTESVLLCKEKIESKEYILIDNTNQNNFADLDEIPYKKAIERDKRDMLMMYWDTFRDNQSLCKVFSPKSIFDLISVKLCLFLFTLSLDFTLNAIFYSDDIVSERYHNEGSLSFFSEVLKSLYSAAIGFILSSFIISFSSYNSVLELIVKEYKYQQGYLSLCAMCLKKVRKRILFFFLLQFLVMFF